MKKTLIVASCLAAVATLAACQKKAEAPAPTPSASMMSGNMANMPMAGAIKHGMAAGTVTGYQLEILVLGTNGYVGVADVRLVSCDPLLWVGTLTSGYDVVITE